MEYPRIFIPSKNREKTISTARYFAGFDYTVLVHNKDQASAYRLAGKATGVDPKRVIVTGVAADQFGLTRQREWAIQNLVEENEWFIFADDNIRDIQIVYGSYYQAEKLPVQEDESLRDVYRSQCDPREFMTTVFNECVAKAESLGVSHMGFASVDNYFFRANKWKSVAYIIGKLMLWKNTGTLVFDHTITMEDFELTAQSILKFGYSLVNNYVYPVAGHYEMGGMGTKKERLPDRLKDVELLTKKYPGLFNVKTRPDGNPDLSLKFYTHDKAMEWRRNLKGLKSVKNLWS